MMKQFVSLLYGVYAKAAENAALVMGADKAQIQNVFFSDVFKAQRKSDIDEFVKQIKKLLEKGTQ